MNAKKIMEYDQYQNAHPGFHHHYHTDKRHALYQLVEYDKASRGIKKSSLFAKPILSSNHRPGIIPGQKEAAGDRKERASFAAHLFAELSFLQGNTIQRAMAYA
jgi:hypothetical protein